MKWLLWALFGNDDDGHIGDRNWNPEQEDTPWIRVKWWFRNPLHNFNFYVIGIADREFVREGRFPKDVFSPIGGWNWAVTKYGGFRLPFLSYSGWCKFYFGWRERGNFGIKFTKGG